VLKHAGHSVPTPAAARVLRFDFHWTDQGWKISEVNSDVPGGYCEASDLPRLMVRNCLPSYSDFARRANLPGVVDLLVS
jgi:hypothetical protein